MGMQPSGNIADSAFYSMAERNFILLTSTRRKYGILYYGRFKDDIVIIFKDIGLDCIRECLEEFKLKAGFFRITIDSFSRYGCQMLDLDISTCETSYPFISSF